MKQIKILFLNIALILSLLFSACGEPSTVQDDNSKNGFQQQTITSEIEDTESKEAPDSYQNIENAQDKSATANDTLLNSQTESNSPQASEELSNSFNSSSIPAYDGKAYVAINSNEPFFTQTDYTTQSFERYSNLDSLGRCGVAYANIARDLMPTEDRGDISSITPSGWLNKNYGDLVDGGYLYNRCHLIGFQLTAENANECNIITGTRYLNTEGMLPFENMVADYVKEANNHVLYRVTPIYEGNNLIAQGVLIEASSVEDNGKDISFCVFCYNVQPGIVIDYATGDSYAEGENSEKPTTPTDSIKTIEYILNTNTHKFHYPDCSSVNCMKESNKEYSSGHRDEIIARGYDPCGRCNP